MLWSINTPSASFLQIFVFQIGALWISHRIIEWKDNKEVAAMGPLMSLPSGKKYHVFCTHTKKHKETEQWVVATKDMLAPKGYSVFFDVVRLFFPFILFGVLTVKCRRTIFEK